MEHWSMTHNLDIIKNYLDEISKDHTVRAEQAAMLHKCESVSFHDKDGNEIAAISLELALEMFAWVDRQMAEVISDVTDAPDSE